MALEKFLDQIFLWKSPLMTEKFLGHGNFLDCRKLTFLTVKYNRSNNSETITIYIFNLEQKLNSPTFFVVDKIIIIFSRRFKYNY